MIVNADSRLARRWRRIRHAALVVVAVTLAHELIYLFRFGQAGVVPADGGHAYWPALLVLAATAVVLLLARARWRLTIGVRITAAGGTRSESGSTTAYRAEWRSIFGRLAPVVAAAYLVIENVEHLVGHGHVEGLGVYLNPSTLLALPIVLALAAATAALGALVRWREIVLVERLRRAAPQRVRITPVVPPRRWLITAALVRRMKLAATSDPNRAPPHASLI